MPRVKDHPKSTPVQPQLDVKQPELEIIAPLINIARDFVSYPSPVQLRELPKGDSDRSAPNKIGAPVILLKADGAGVDPLGDSGRTRSTGLATPVTLEDRYPIKKGGLSEADVRRAAAEIDSNHDGKLTSVEVAQFSALSKSRGFADKDARELFRRMEAGAALFAIQGEVPGRQGDKTYLEGPFARELGKLGATSAQIEEVKNTLAPQVTSELGTDAQTPELKELERAYQVHANDPAARKTLAALVGSKGFAELPAEQREKLLRLADGKNDDWSKSARSHLDTLMATPAFAGGTPAEQKKLLQDFMTNEPYLPHDTGAYGTYPATGAAYTKHGDTSPPYPKTIEVEMDGRRIPVTMETPGPPPNGGHQKSVDQVFAAISRMPKLNRDQIKEVTIRGVESDAATPGGGFMSIGGSGHLSMWPTSQEQNPHFTWTTMLHETGHVLSDNKWGDTSDKRWDPWKKAMEKDATSPSKYGKCGAGTTHCTTVADDFAEAYRLYATVKGTPLEAEVKRLMPERWKILEAM